MSSTKDTKKSRGEKKVRKATKKQRRKKVSKSGHRKGEESASSFDKESSNDGEG
jgi:hypothetical protein